LKFLILRNTTSGTSLSNACGYRKVSRWQNKTNRTPPACRQRQDISVEAPIGAPAKWRSAQTGRHPPGLRWAAGHPSARGAGRHLAADEAEISSETAIRHGLHTKIRCGGSRPIDGKLVSRFIG